FPESPILEESGTYVFQFESGEVRVRPEMDGGRIDLNGADEKLLGSMFDAIGVDPARRDELVDCILDWRDEDDFSRPNGAEINDSQKIRQDGKRLPANARFNTVQEVLMVKNMTPEIYLGRIAFDPATNQVHKKLGLRDIATAGPGRAQIDTNTAPVEVLSLIPGITSDLVAGIVEARGQKPFATPNDLFERVSGLKESPAHDYVGTDAGLPSLLISTATLRPSGTQKTVRL